MTEKWGQIQAKWNLFELAGGSSSYRSSSYRGFYCIILLIWIVFLCKLEQSSEKKKIDQTLHSLV